MVTNENSLPLVPPPVGLSALAHIPGDPGLPFLGTVLTQLRDYVGFGRVQRARFGPVYRTHSFGVHGVATVDPAHAERILQNRGPIVSSEQGWWPYLGMLVPRGLMMLDGDEHSLHRRILVGAFRREAMQGYQELISTTVDEAMGSWPLGKSLPIYNRVKELTLGLAARVILGLDPGPKTEHLNSDFVRLLGGSVAILRWRLPGTTWDRAVRSRDRIRSMLRQVVSNCRTRSEIGRDMVSMLCLARDEDGNGLSDEQVVQHALFMLVAAHDTTTVTVVNAVYELGKHPEWQEKLRSELLDVVDADGVVALESLRATVDEVLRLHPPVPVIPRRSLQPLNLGGFDVPAGTMIFIPAAMVHRDAACWTSGDSFDPTRFSRERAEHKKLPGAWLPFGGGAHACIGKLFGYTEIHLVLGELLRRFRWTLPDGYSPAFQHLPFPIPRDGLRVAFHPQHQP